MLPRFSAFLCVCLFFVGCSGTISTVRRDGAAYTVTREEAHRIVEESVRASFPAPGTVTPSPAGTLACSGNLRRFGTYITVHAAALPVVGSTPAGNPARGYAFVVSYWGNLPFPPVPQGIYRSIVGQATAQGLALKVDRKSVPWPPILPKPPEPTPSSTASPAPEPSPVATPAPAKKSPGAPTPATKPDATPLAPN